MRSLRGDRILIYLSSQCTVFVHLDKLAARTGKAIWINPTNGESREAGSFLTGNLNGKVFPEGRVQYFSTPGHWEDAILMLEEKE